MMNKEKRFHSHYRWIFWIIVGICGCLLMVSPGKNLKAEAVTVTVQDSEEEAATETVQSSGQEGTVSDWVKTTSEATGDGDSIYIAGNPDKFPVEYYNSDTRCYEGILPELLKQIGEKTGLRFTDSNLNHTGIYLYSKGKIMIHLTFDYQSDEGCTTPGQYLRYHRTFQGLTTRELAEKVGVVPATLVLYENDRHPIKHSTAVALANVLGIDRSRLLDEYTVFVDYPYSSLLKKVRRELSFTQMQMAEVIGIGQTTYSGWEREVRVPRRKEHEKILAAMKKLKVDVDTYLCQPNPL